MASWAWSLLFILVFSLLPFFSSSSIYGVRSQGGCSTWPWVSLAANNKKNGLVTLWTRSAQRHRLTHTAVSLLARSSKDVDWEARVFTGVYDDHKAARADVAVLPMTKVWWSASLRWRDGRECGREDGRVGKGRRPSVVGDVGAISCMKAGNHISAARVIGRDDTSGDCSGRWWRNFMLSRCKKKNEKEGGDKGEEEEEIVI